MYSEMLLMTHSEPEWSGCSRECFLPPTHRVEISIPGVLNGFPSSRKFRWASEMTNKLVIIYEINKDLLIVKKGHFHGVHCLNAPLDGRTGLHTVLQPPRTPRQNLPKPCLKIRNSTVQLRIFIPTDYIILFVLYS